MNFKMRILMVLGFLVIGLKSSAEASLNCHVNAPSFRACEKLVSGRMFSELVLSFPDGEFSGSPLGILARNFYRGVGLFGLFVKERVSTRRCELVRRSQEDLALFLKNALKHIAYQTDPVVFDWILRANIYAKQLDRVKNCVRPPFSEYRIKRMVEQMVETQLAQFINDDEKRAGSFDRVYGRLKDIISLTSDIINKISTFSTQMKMVDFKINEDDGTATVIIEGWARPVLEGDRSETERIDSWLGDLEGRYVRIDLSRILAGWQQAREINRREARLSLNRTALAKTYVKNVITENRQYQELLGQARVNIEHYRVIRDASHSYKREMKRIYQTLYQSSCRTDDTYWWCQ
jgi:hypothetical protein